MIGAAKLTEHMGALVLTPSDHQTRTDQDDRALAPRKHTLYNKGMLGQPEDVVAVYDQAIDWPCGWSVP